MQISIGFVKHRYDLQSKLIIVANSYSTLWLLFYTSDILHGTLLDGRQKIGENVGKWSVFSKENFGW
jgi:hypothetical protein